jgi:hypothetical protein
MAHPLDQAFAAAGSSAGALDGKRYVVPVDTVHSRHSPRPTMKSLQGVSPSPECGGERGECVLEMAEVLAEVVLCGIQSGDRVVDVCPVS